MLKGMLEVDEYLKGYIDGYKKAKENSHIASTEIKIDGRAIAKAIYSDVIELQEKEKRIKEMV